MQRGNGTCAPGGYREFGETKGTTGKCVCTCFPGFSGADCATSMQCYASTSPTTDLDPHAIMCGVNGKVEGTTGGCRCECMPGYEGSDCSTALTQAPQTTVTASSTGSFVVDPAHHIGQHCINPGWPSVNQWSAYAQRVSGATSATQCVGDAGAASSGCGDYMFWKSGQCWCVKASYGSTTCADVITTSGPYTIYKRSAAVRMKMSTASLPPLSRP